MFIFINQRRHFVAVFLFVFSGILLSLPVNLRAESKLKAQVDSQIVTIEVSGNKARFLMRKRITIFSLTGDDYSYIVIGTSPYIKLKSFHGELFSSDGKKIYTRDKGDLYTECGYGISGLYSDHCFQSLAMRHASYPYTIVYEYELEMASLFYLRDVIWESEIPTQNTAVMLSYETSAPIRYKLYGVAGNGTHEQLNDRERVSWSFATIDARKELKGMPPWSFSTRKIDFVAERFALGKYKCDGLTWKNVGSWYRSLSLDADIPLTSNTANPEVLIEKANAIYERISSQMNYVNVSVKLSGWQPDRLASIRQKSYGDCKDMTADLVNTLRSEGIAAYPVLVLTSDEGAIDSRFVNFGFNHAITVAIIGNDTLWYDPTCTVCPPGELPEGDQGTTALIATDTGGVLVVIPRAKAEENRLVRKTTMQAQLSRGKTLSVSALFAGVNAHNMRYVIKHSSQEDQDRYIRSVILNDNPSVKIANCKIDNPSNMSEPASVECDLQFVGTIDRVGATTYLFPFLFSDKGSLAAAELDNRTSPVWLGSSVESIDSVTILIDSVVTSTIISLPENVSESYDWGTISAEYQRTDTSISACLRRVIYATEIPVTSFDAFKTYLSNKTKILNAPIKFTAAK